MLHNQYDRIWKSFLIFACGLAIFGLAALPMKASALPIESSALPSGTPLSTEVPDRSEEPEATLSPTEEPTMSPKPTAAPKALKVTLKQSGKKMKLSWKKYSGALKYQVEVKRAGKSFKKYKKTKKKIFLLKYSAGKTYYVRVNAYGQHNKKLVTSAVYSFYIPKGTSQISAFYTSSNMVELSWNPVKKADYYLIYRKRGSGPYRRMKQTRKCAYTDRGVSGGNIYRYQIKAVYKQGKMLLSGKSTTRTYDTRKIVATDHQKYSYEEMASDIYRLSRKYPSTVHYHSIGRSEDGRNIYDVVLGNQNASKSILVVSTLHAREYMASLLCMNQIEYYARNYQEKRDGEKMSTVFNQVCLHYITMANPDGVTISQRGIRGIRNKKLYKKLKKLSKGVNTSRWKANARGVDLNDNFPYQFQRNGKAGSSGYSGIKAASTREAAAIVRRIKQLKGHNLRAVINYHAMGSIVFGSSDGLSGTALAAKTTQMYNTARKVTGYGSAASYSSRNGSSGGGLREYALYTMRVPSITLEIGRIACPGPSSEFPRIWRENKDLLYQEAKLF